MGSIPAGRAIYHQARMTISDISQLAKVLVVLAIAAFALLNPLCAFHKFNLPNPFDHFKTDKSVFGLITNSLIV